MNLGSTLHFDTACHTVRHGIQSMLGDNILLWVFFIKFIISLLYTHILVKGYYLDGTQYILILYIIYCIHFHVMSKEMLHYIYP